MVAATNIGYITQIIGPVIDVEFPDGTLPKMFNALNVFMFSFWSRGLRISDV